MTHRKRILLIDDEKDFCFFVRQNLLRSGEFSVIYTTNPNKGIKIAKKESPDLILLDILMPKKDGFEVLKILKENTKTLSIPVIMLTAVGDDNAKLRASYLYDEDYITKPVSFETLKTRIEAVFKRQKGMNW